MLAVRNNQACHSTALAIRQVWEPYLGTLDMEIGIPGMSRLRTQDQPSQKRVDMFKPGWCGFPRPVGGDLSSVPVVHFRWLLAAQPLRRGKKITQMSNAAR